MPAPSTATFITSWMWLYSTVLFLANGGAGDLVPAQDDARIGHVVDQVMGHERDPARGATKMPIAPK